MTSPSATLSRDQAAAFLGVSLDTLDRLRARGELPAIQVSPRRVCYRERDLEAYLDGKTLRSAAGPSGSAPGGGPAGVSKVDTRAAIQRAREVVRKMRLKGR